MFLEDITHHKSYYPSGSVYNHLSDIILHSSKNILQDWSIFYDSVVALLFAYRNINNQCFVTKSLVHTRSVRLHTKWKI